MKKLLMASLSLLFVWACYAQTPTKKADFKVPTASPDATFTQHFGESEIKVTYGRPLARGRKVFGNLVPFDSLWRTGAGDCTTIELSEEVGIGGKKMAPGKYALFTIPGIEEWTIVLNSDVSLHGAFGYTAQKDVHRFKVKAHKTERFYEIFTIEINDFAADGSASLNLIWENTQVKIPLITTSDERIMTEIRQRLLENKEQDADLLFQAANYYYTTRRDLKQATTWVSAAEKLDVENFAIPNLAQKIFADTKQYSLAIDAAKRAIALAEKQNRTSAVTSLKKRIAEWQQLLKSKP